MAKQTALQLVNKVLNNIGESSISTLSSVSGLALLTFNTVNEVLYDLAHEYRLQPLEADGTITLGSGTSTYSYAADQMAFDKDSFRYDNAKNLEYYTAQRIDRSFISQTDTGVPQIIFSWRGYFKPYRIPNSAAHGKIINYRYWKLPTPISTASDAGTCYMPEGFDLTMLADYVTYKILHYKHNDEAQLYYQKVWGDGGQNEGSLAKFKQIYGSPLLLDTEIFTEPMEGSGPARGMIQNPITG